jgi:hypothetical protein
MLFTSSDKVMTKLKEDLKSSFDVTDLGEPFRIVGIEIGQRADSLMISQPLYVDSILRKYRMENANPVSTPSQTPPSRMLKIKDQFRDMFSCAMGAQ